MSTKFSLSSLEDNFLFPLKSFSFQQPPLSSSSSSPTSPPLTTTTRSGSESSGESLFNCQLSSYDDIESDGKNEDDSGVDFINKLISSQQDYFLNKSPQQHQTYQTPVTSQFNNNSISLNKYFDSLELDDETIFNLNSSLITSPPPPQSSSSALTSNCDYPQCLFKRRNENFRPNINYLNENYAQFHCLNEKCRDKKYFIHELCYEAILVDCMNNNLKRARSNSFDYSTTLNKYIQQHQQQNINCFNCNNETLCLFTSNNQSQQNYKQQQHPPSTSPSVCSSSTSSSPNLDEYTNYQFIPRTQLQKQPQTQQQAVKFQPNVKNQTYYSPPHRSNASNNNNNSLNNKPTLPINIHNKNTNNFNKKSNNSSSFNPPLPTPMQPSSVNNKQQINKNNTNFQSYSYNKSYSNNQKQQNYHYGKQTAPVNMNKANNSRYRTISTGSSGSFSASSSFSSSMGVSPVLNSWSNKKSQQTPSSFVSNTSSGHFTGATTSVASSLCSNSSISTYCKQNDTKQVINEKSVEIEENSDKESGNLFSSDVKLAATGNMFHRRDEWSIINKLPVDKQNSMHVRTEDEGPYGNDETRCFLLSHLSSLKVREIKCILCECEMNIYDRFPLVDGTLFVSPHNYNKELALNAFIANKEQHIYGVCLKCLNGENEIKCKCCQTKWQSQSLQIGTLYKYDIFAAFPCCQKRLNCNKCSKCIYDFNSATLPPYFSSYSEEKECQHCKTKAYHFIKPLDHLFSKTNI